MPKSPARHKLSFWAETEVFRAIRKQAHWIAFLTIVFAIAGDLLASREAPRYEAVAEIMPPFDYQYTPFPTNNSSEAIQVRFDPDIAINNELRVLASPEVRHAARDAVPQPDVPRLEPSPPRTKIDLQLAVIEGSSMIRMSVTDPDPVWAKSYLSALIAEYQKARDAVFSQTDQQEQLLEERELAFDQINAIERKQGEIYDEARQILTAGLNGLTTAERADVLAFGEQLRALDGFEPIADALKALTGGSSGAGSSEASARKAEAQPAAALDPQHRRDLLERARALSLERKALDDRLEGLDQALTRMTLRQSTNRDVAIIAAPRASDKPIGLPHTTIALISMVVGFLLASIAAIVIEGYRKQTGRAV